MVLCSFGWFLTSFDGFGGFGLFLCGTSYVSNPGPRIQFQRLDEQDIFRTV